jgi:hypothetical protein
LIAVRRHCERSLPHMSWFLAEKPGADQEKLELEEEKS